MPRRVYSQSHVDYVIEVVIEVAQRARELRGYCVTWAREVLRHFTAELAPIE